MLCKAEELRFFSAASVNIVFLATALRKNAPGSVKALFLRLRLIEALTERSVGEKSAHPIDRACVRACSLDVMWRAESPAARSDPTACASNSDKMLVHVCFVAGDAHKPSVSRYMMLGGVKHNSEKVPQGSDLKS